MAYRDKVLKLGRLIDVEHEILAWRRIQSSGYEHMCLESTAQIQVGENVFHCLQLDRGFPANMAAVDDGKRVWRRENWDYMALYIAYHTISQPMGVTATTLMDSVLHVGPDIMPADNSFIRSPSPGHSS